MTEDRADLFDRFLAKAIDGAFALFLCFMVPPAGTLLGVLYLLSCDALLDGASPAKHLIGLRCVHRTERRSCSFRESALRNLPFAIPTAFLLLPAVGPILFVLVGGPVLLFEAYLLYTDPNGTRIGDIFADSMVVRSVRRSNRIRRRSKRTSSEAELAQPASKDEADLDRSA